MKTHNTVQRVNITLPSEMLLEVDSVARKGGRSRFIKQALDFYIQKMKQMELKAALKEESVARFEENKVLAEDWSFIENEAWEKSKK